MSDQLKEMIEQAISYENCAIDYYKKLAEMASYKETTQTIKALVDDELLVVEKLVGLVEADKSQWIRNNLKNLKSENNLFALCIKETMSFEEAIILAMRKEKESYRFYKSLANATEGDKISKIFNELALKASDRKLQFELAYDDYVLSEN